LCKNINLLKKKAEQQKKRIRHERYEYFTGKADPEVYLENPFPKKIRDKETLQGYLDSDEKLSNVALKIEYYETLLNYILVVKIMQHQAQKQYILILTG
jgi:hypothetical protein